MQKRSTDGTAIPGNCQSCDHRQKRQLRQINELSFEPERGRIGRLLLLLFNNFSVFLFHFFEAAHFNLLSHLLLKEERKEGGASTPTRWWMMSMASPPPAPPPEKNYPNKLNRGSPPRLVYIKLWRELFLLFRSVFRNTPKIRLYFDAGGLFIKPTGPI